MSLSTASSDSLIVSNTVLVRSVSTRYSRLLPSAAISIIPLIQAVPSMSALHASATGFPRDTCFENVLPFPS